MAQEAVRQGQSGSASRWLRAVTAAGVALALVVGCAESTPEPGPSVVTPRPTTEQPAPEPEVDLPEKPVAPEPRTGTPDERDAEDAAEFFVELYEYTLATGDAEEWISRSAPDCGFCSNVSEHVQQHVAAGASFVGGEFEIEPAQFVAFDDVLVMFAAQVPFTVSPVQVVDESGNVLEEHDAGGGYLLLEFLYAPATGWQLHTGSVEQESYL